MRVVVISEHYHPQIGGAERVSQAIAEASAAEGWDTHVFTSGKPSDVEHLNDVTIHRFEISGNMTKGIKGDTRLIRKHLNELHPEVIVVYALQTWGADILLQNGNTAPSGARVILVPCGLSALSTLTRRLYYFSYLKRLKRDWQRFDHYIF
ncbi:MAG TPA: hypothetical protein ENK49_14505, partial [Gammaproteobacteria bacterium]|nr:hypothetical protein [Gammaproteobacteria bacterium]